MKRRYLIIAAVVLGSLLAFWPQVSKTATGVAQHTYQIVDHLGNVIGGNASATTGVAQGTINVVDSTGHILDTFISAAIGTSAGVTTVTGALIVNNPAGKNSTNDIEIGFDTTGGTSQLAFDTVLGGASYWQFTAAPSGNGTGTDFAGTAVGGAGSGGFADYNTNDTLRPGAWQFDFSFGSVPHAFQNNSACSSTMTGQKDWVTDALTNKLGDVVSAGAGSFSVGITCDGTNWRVSETNHLSVGSLCQGTSANIATATTDFVACGENPGVVAITSEANSQTIVSSACIVTNLTVKLTTATAAGHDPVITVDKNAAGTALTCTVGDGLTICVDTTHNFTTVAGDLLSISFANPASANATGVVYIAYQINC